MIRLECSGAPARQAESQARSRNTPSHAPSSHAQAHPPRSHSESHPRSLQRPPSPPAFLAQVPILQRRTLACPTSTTQTRGRRMVRKMGRLGESVAVRRSLCILGARHIQLGASASSASHPLLALNLPRPTPGSCSPFSASPLFVFISGHVLGRPRHTIPKQVRTACQHIASPSIFHLLRHSPSASSPHAVPVSRPSFPSPRAVSDCHGLHGTHRSQLGVI
ncbi:hypothetical protein GY45DRAFT_1319622 [Cubamyces sp. BRFM 1775]|nr:hypothetical protein GY45DRAFT_1319622 [Cubamyces sp. BRFM 1775]